MNQDGRLGAGRGWRVVLTGALAIGLLAASAPHTPVVPDPVAPTEVAVTESAVSPESGPESASACPEPVPMPDLDDVDPEATHGQGIACLLALGISQGATATAYEPGGVVARGQMASFLVRLLRAAGDEPPAPALQPFEDVAGSTHADAIARLAGVGLVAGTSPARYAPDEPVRRDQMASFLDRAVGHLDAEAIEMIEGIDPSDPGGQGDPEPTTFEDVDPGNVHREAIERLAAAGLVQGRSGSSYDPAGLVTRDQMASFLVRVADLLAAAGRLHAHYAPIDPVVASTTRVLGAADLDALTGVDADGTLSFEAPPRGIEVGTVLVAGPHASAPDGFIGRVSAVDGAAVHTDAAALTDAVAAGTGQASFRPRLDRALDQQIAVGAEVSAPSVNQWRLEVADLALADGVEASAAITFDLGTEVDLGIAERDGAGSYLVRLDATTSGNQDLDLRFRAEDAATLDAEVPLLRASFAPVVTAIHGVPVMLVPELLVTLEARGTAAAGTAFAATQSASGTAGAFFTPAGGIRAEGGREQSFGAVEVALERAADVELAVAITQRFAVAGVGRLATTTTPFVRAVADPQTDPAWVLDGGAHLGGEMRGGPTRLGGSGAGAASLDVEEELAVAPPPEPTPADPPPADPVRIAPGWYAAGGTGPVVGTSGTLSRYTVEITDGLAQRQDVEEFRGFVDDRLGDPTHGWTARGSHRLQRVDDPAQARIRVLLATPATVDRLCARAGLNTGGVYSCWNGRFAAINATRWFQGVDHVADLGLYRSYLINHEVGHGLGYGHRSCPAPGRTAPVMMQLSKSTYGCVPNPHPYP